MRHGRRRPPGQRSLPRLLPGAALGFRGARIRVSIRGLGFRVRGLGFIVCLGIIGFRVQGSGFRVYSVFRDYRV